MANSPCKDCPRHELGCRNNCRNYRKYEKELSIERKNRESYNQTYYGKCDVYTSHYPGKVFKSARK